MKKSLTIDIGNSRIKVGVFDGNGTLRVVRIFSLSQKRECYSFINSHNDNTPGLICSTSYSEKEFIRKITADNIGILSAEMHFPIRFTYNGIWSLGKDRMAGVVGAYMNSNCENILLIDIGTCITYDFVEKSGVHLGGMISPGLQMRYRAMHRWSEHLPEVGEGRGTGILATDTIGALRYGGKTGLTIEVKGYIRKLKQLYKNFCVYLTGGESRLFKSILSEEVRIDNEIILKGLYEILKWNEKKY